MNFASSISQGLVGGILIGASAAALLLGNGDVLGASGILSSIALSPKQAVTDPSQHWKLCFVASFLSTSAFFGPYYNMTEAVSGARPINMLGYGISGFLVGFGTKLSNGCTSGHGVCGLARLSRRSFAAVGTFMAFGMATTIATSPKMSWAAWTSILRTETNDVSTRMNLFGCGVAAFTVLAALAAPIFHQRNAFSPKILERKCFVATASGALFAAGLYVSTMVFPDKVTGFLEITDMLEGSWDATLLGVLGGACVVSFVSYQFLEEHSIMGRFCKPIHHPMALTPHARFSIPKNTTVDKSLLGGAALFGIGWGISGFCPGPALFAAGAGFPAIIWSYWPAFLAGSYLAIEWKVRA
jgi:uncharacterized membrane protein YedE/YeeE